VVAGYLGSLGRMELTSRDIAQRVQQILSSHTYRPPAPGTTVGMPWSETKISQYITLLKQSLVPPRLERFKLSETPEQVTSRTDQFANYWVVAERDSYVEWFDPHTEEFGLGQRGLNGEGFVSVGVRGDLAGVFCAM
jgi:hypothetical protein